MLKFLKSIACPSFRIHPVFFCCLLPCHISLYWSTLFFQVVNEMKKGQHFCKQRQSLQLLQKLLNKQNHAKRSFTYDKCEITIVSITLNFIFQIGMYQFQSVYAVGKKDGNVALKSLKIQSCQLYISSNMDSLLKVNEEKKNPNLPRPCYIIFIIVD